MELLKAIFGKNSLVTLVIGAIFFILGAVSNFTIGKFIYPTPDIFGRIALIFLGVILIGFGLFFTYLEYRTSSPNVKTENNKTSEVQPGITINYRDTIRLLHSETKFALHSHLIDYHHEGSSKQQQVTGFGGLDENDYWIVKGPHGRNEFIYRNNPVKNGDVIRLEHRNTRKNLHSHPGLPSPLTGQQEVTAYSPENNGIGNLDDNWQVEVEDGGAWVIGTKVRLIHSRTKAALHSHNKASKEFTSNQQEVTGFNKRNEDDFWVAEIVEGV